MKLNPLLPYSFFQELATYQFSNSFLKEDQLKGLLINHHIKSHG